ncbi:MAG TPA: DEAD/DEAH box helicase [Dinghuibacter sp.]|jgi:ATP-dependent RNA helicase DeaD|uniref:DEAD/DEAH box helicase n=1 Tax=Dinghuibacter sp. TaxID=2024697 RepID=UPI002B6D3BBA|nr:DEAD/DEAH box helicase [Dinghuibacter sp.]HTJ13957.1 DEAD/DEAH box helicase [Dinghuibacter sp.]
MSTFEALGLDARLIQATDALGYETPTAIQEKAIPVLLGGQKDFIGLAQTGTGKTAAFSLPLLHLLEVEKRYPQALVVCPTRELCLQIVNEIELFKKFIPGMHVTAVYGGASIALQIRDLRKGVQIVVATPGRLIDLIERKAIDLQNIHYIVLDEADEMLNMGFRDDIEFILQNTPNRESTWLFSATMPDAVRQVSKRYMTDPEEVTVGKKNTANANIDHQYYVTSAQQRFETLKRIIDFNPGMYGIIFTRTKLDAQDIAEKLVRDGYDIDALHGDLTQQQRDKVMGQFRDRSLQLLVATDVAARGIDVNNITHVINYELPDDVEVYTHRTGRTGRAGKSGIALSIVHVRETFKLKQIERVNNIRMNKMDIPTGKDVCRKQFYYFMDRILNADTSHGDYETFVPMIEEKFANISKEEIVKRFAALEFDRFLKYYENAADLNIRDRDPRTQRQGTREFGPSAGGDRRRFESGAGSGSGEMTKLFINVGIKDGFYKASFLQFILDMSDLRKEVLGRIDLKEMNSWVEVDKKAASKMIKAIDGKTFKGRKIRMNEANR